MCICNPKSTFRKCAEVFAFAFLASAIGLATFLFAGDCKAAMPASVDFLAEAWPVLTDRMKERAVQFEAAKRNPGDGRIFNDSFERVRGEPTPPADYHLCWPYWVPNTIPCYCINWPADNADECL